MNNLVVFATYWNERKWIEASLRQIEKLNPKKIVICDGCYDPSKPNCSTDGTREIITDFVNNHSNAVMIDALRYSKLKHFFSWYKNLPHEQVFNFHPARIIESLRMMKLNEYRLNQMATFNHMLSLAFEKFEDCWFMSYDADQFYDDNMIDKFDIVNQSNSKFKILSGVERTFLEDFEHYTLDHESRDYNNMPHRLQKTTRFIPTRHPVLIKGLRYKIYSHVESKFNIGYYNHYKINDTQRTLQGYALGDRKEINARGLKMLPFKEKHPSVTKI